MSRVARRQFIFVCVFLVVVLVFVTTFRMGVVRGDSMKPTYENGQVVLVRRRNWFSAPLYRNDVILLRRGREVLIKRIYRLPGEEITDEAMKQYILVADRTDGMADYFEQQPGRTPEEGTRYFLPKDYLFVLGDNPRVSEDSRLFGPIPLRDVLGVVVDAPDPPPPGANALPEDMPATPPPAIFPNRNLRPPLRTTE
jgi:signal peptidase I